MLTGLLGWKRVKNGLHWPSWSKGKVRGYYYTVRCRLTGRIKSRYVGEPYVDSETGESVSDWSIL